MRGTAGSSQATKAETGHSADTEFVAVALADRRAFTVIYARYVEAIFRYCDY